MKDRPFHCVDGSRSKYMLKTGGSWQIDKNGKKIIEGIFPRIIQLCIPPFVSSMEEMDNWRIKNGYMVELTNGGDNKIIKRLNEVALLKNNVKAIKN